MKFRHVAALSVVAALAFAGCDKIKQYNPFVKKQPATPAPAPAVEPVVAKPAAKPATKPAAEPLADASPAEPAPAAATPPPKPAPPVIDKSAQVVVICYHRLEGRAGGGLSIEPALFEKHMQELKDKNIPVISMNDFLAWRKNEKSIPPKCAILTIDDGYESGMRVGVPILKKFGYTATYYIYTTYVNSGGKSLSWGQLAELRDEGFDIGSHTVSHQDLRRKPSKAKFPDYDSWLKDEMETSKRLIEENLGIRVTTIAYPFGLHNSKVHAATQAAGYELGFTVYGQRVGHDAAPYTIGRYDVTAKDAQGNDGFTAAISFQGPASSSAPVLGVDAQSMMVTEPMNGSVINEAKPTLRANLASLGALDAGSVEMRVSGFGLVPAQFDANSKAITYTFQQPLRPGTVTVIISGKARGQRVETKWSFKYDPAAKPAELEAPAELPPRKP
ncbi:MAG: polysaccharide deacetylase family protein [Chthoniobacteraceae bacterium]